jgi:hypothetical protein
MADIQFTLTDGLNRDISKDKYPTSAYYYLLNGRINSTKNATLTDITNIVGNSNALIDDDGYTDRTGYSIIGYTTIRNDIIVFYAKNTSLSDDFTSNCYIDLLKYSNNDRYYHLQLWSGIGLNFRMDKPITAIGRYENPLIQKIYWVDNNNTFKFANVAPDIETIGLESYNNINSYTVNDFEIVKDIVLSDSTGSLKPSFVNYTSGNLYGGVIQYCYRLYDKYSAYTFVSDLSEPIILTKGQINSNITNLYGMETAGQTEDLQTGKGVLISINLNNVTNKQYSICEIISLHYSNYYDTPTVSIIGKREIKDNILFIDEGGVSDYGTIPYTEFLLFNSSFSAKTLEVKDDILFAGNIKEDYFDLDEKLGYYWDARAYRYEKNKTTTQMINNGTRFNHSVGNSVAIDNDCINPYNLEWDTTGISGYGNMEGFGNENYAYWSYNADMPSEAEVLGGKGLNIDFCFSQFFTYIDDGNNDNTISKTNFDRFDLGRETSWRRGEIYRLGIVFFDKKGRQSFAKWIADIKIPDNIIQGLVKNANGYWESLSGSFAENNNKIRATIIQPEIIVKNRPIINGEVLTYKIVYVKREATDKTILTQGLLSIASVSEDQNSLLDTHRLYKSYYYMFENHPVFGFISPEITLNPNYLDNYDGLYTKVYGTNETYKNPEFNSFLERAYKVHHNIYKLQNYDYSNFQNIYNISDNQMTFPTQTYSANNNQATNYLGLYNNRRGIIGRRYAFSLPSAFQSDTTFSDGWFNLEIRRNILGYGGYTYEDRFFNTYISASRVSNSLRTICRYGDTYLCMMEYQDTTYFADSDDSFHEVRTFYFPCETDYNLRLRHDETHSKNIGNSLIAFIQETGNQLLFYKEYDNSDNATEVTKVTNWEDLYLYNTIFNKPTNAINYFPKPQNYIPISKNDTLIKYSDKKINNEEIDSWIIFRPNNYNNLNSNYGQLNKLIQFQNYLFYFQDSAVGIATVNPLVTTVSTQGTEVILGAGGVLETFTYLSTEIGCQDNSDVIKSFSALYWLDKNKKKIYSYTSGDSGGIGSISDLKNMHSYFYNNIFEDSKCIGVYDTKNSQVLLTITNPFNNSLFWYTNLGNNQCVFTGSYLTKDLTEITKFVEGSVYKIEGGYYRFLAATQFSYYFSYLYGEELVSGSLINFSEFIFEKNTFTLGYNELYECFESFYSFIPTLYINHSKGYFSTENNNDLYQHDIGLYNTFYGVTYPTTLKLIIAGNGVNQLEANNIRFYSEIRDIKGNYLRNETITNISAKTNYEQSEDIILYPMDLNNDYSRDRLVLDTSGLKIGNDYYIDKVSNNEEIVIFNNQIYRSLIEDNNTTPAIGNNWKLCELCNIRKTIEHWQMPFPRYIPYRGTIDGINENVGNNQMIDRFRGNWIELTLELKDTILPNNLKNKNLLLSDVKVNVRNI